MPNYKYCIGDRVRVISQSERFHFYCMNDSSASNTINEEMRRWHGKPVTIAGISYGQYRINEDEGHWLWTDEMFEGLADEPSPHKKPKLPKIPIYKKPAEPVQEPVFEPSPFDDDYSWKDCLF